MVPICLSVSHSISGSKSIKLEALLYKTQLNLKYAHVRIGFESMAQVSDVLLPELVQWEKDGIPAVKKDK